MRVLELFAGYGSQALALENLGIEFTSDISEIDKYAIQSYNQLHGETYNWGDITKIDEKELPYYDLITYSFPCQDISLAGLQKGLDNDSGTRSSLLWECERIIRAVKPKYLLMENVKNLVGEKHKHNFIRWLRVLEMMGYQNWWKVLNAKDYGVPQNRERVFVVSILGGGQYLFPNKIKLEKRLKDVLEENVEEKYYLDDNIVEKFLKKIETNHKDDICIGGMQEHQSITTNGISTCLTSSMGSGGGYVPMITEPLCAASRGKNPDNPSDRTVGSPIEQRLEINKDGVSNILTSVQKDNWVVEHTVNQIGNLFQTDSFGGNPQTGRVYSDNGLSPTLNTMQGGGREPKIANGYQIRKLTPRECWRLMGVKDEQFDKLHDLSNTQLYKLAGNSIVVDVLMGIFKNMFLENDSKGQLTLL